MNNITGEEVHYIVYQEKPEVNEGVNLTVPLTYNAYNGSFNEAYAISQATLFDSEEEAVQLATLQNQMSQILRQEFNYIVVERVGTRTIVYPEDKIGEIEGPEDATVEDTPEDTQVEE